MMIAKGLTSISQNALNKLIALRSRLTVAELVNICEAAGNTRGLELDPLGREGLAGS